MRDSSSGRLDIPQPKIVMFYIFSITDESHERKRFFYWKKEEVYAPERGMLRFGGDGYVNKYDTHRSSTR